MVLTYKYWHKMLSFALYAYRTIVKTSTRAALYSLVYRIKITMLLEMKILLLKVLVHSKLEQTKWEKVRYK